VQIGIIPPLFTSIFSYKLFVGNVLLQPKQPFLAD
jgi:hypothetical protein